jgi:hypothetical protein
MKHGYRQVLYGAHFVKVQMCHLGHCISDFGAFDARHKKVLPNQKYLHSLGNAAIESIFP